MKMTLPAVWNPNHVRVVECGRSFICSRSQLDWNIPFVSLWEYSFSIMQIPLETNKLLAATCRPSLWKFIFILFILFVVLPLPSWIDSVLTIERISFLPSCICGLETDKIKQRWRISCLLERYRVASRIGRYATHASNRSGHAAGVKRTLFFLSIIPGCKNCKDFCFLPSIQNESAAEIRRYMP